MSPCLLLSSSLFSFVCLSLCSSVPCLSASLSLWLSAVGCGTVFAAGTRGGGDHYSLRRRAYDRGICVARVLADRRQRHRLRYRLQPQERTVRYWNILNRIRLFRSYPPPSPRRTHTHTSPIHVSYVFKKMKRYVRYVFISNYSMNNLGLRVSSFTYAFSTTECSHTLCFEIQQHNMFSCFQT